MELYVGSARQFLRDSMENRLSPLMEEAWFAHTGYKATEAEVRSWRNSLRAMADVVRMADFDEQGVLLEYQLPMTSRRIDCVITGRARDASERGAIVELKQWEACARTAGDNVVTWVGGDHREVLHPSVQVGAYQRYLEDCHTAFAPGGVGLDSCAYLHNYTIEEDDPLLDAKFEPYLRASPVYGMLDARRLATELQTRLVEGKDGLLILEKIRSSHFRPSKKLMENVSAAVRGESRFVLLDEQIHVFDKVMTLLRKGFHHRRKHAVIVHGGPGTGKSVLAVNLLGQLAKEGHAANLATGSGAFTKTLRKILGRDAGNAFQYFNGYAQAQENDLDVLILDEAHRIRQTSNHRYTKPAQRSTRPQIEEILHAAKVTVFFLDEHQGIRSDEVGSPALIRDSATRMGVHVHEIRLEAQFRCAGSEAFVNWVNNTLQIQRTANALWEGDENFDFRLVDTPEELERLIRQRAAQGHSARLAAGYCWDWSKTLDPDGGLRRDVQLGSWERPWNARPDMARLPPGVPKSDYWAHDPAGIDQIGCVYTAQGFEFDYVGVIWGPDLVYDWTRNAWRGDPKKSYDVTVKRGGDDFLRLVKNTYRVLLSRGLRGCYLHITDPDTRRFVQSRMSSLAAEGSNRRDSPRRGPERIS